MIDIRCERCGAKLGWRFPEAYGVTIKCSCGAKNTVRLENFSENKATLPFTTSS